MKFVFFANKKTSHVFFPLWGIGLFTAFILVVLVFVFPFTLFKTVIKNSQPSLTTLAYLKTFKMFYPGDKTLTRLIIEQEIGLGQLKYSKKTITSLKTNTSLDEIELTWIEYLMLRYQASKVKPNTTARLNILKILRQLENQLSVGALDNYQRQIIANDALWLGQARLALVIYLDLMNKKALTTAAELANGGSIAMQNNEPLISAKFYWSAYKKSRHWYEKKRYALQTLQALQAANHVKQAVQLAKKLPPVIINGREMLLYLTHLMIAGNKIDSSEKYLTKILKASPRDIIDLQKKLKKIPYDSELFKLAYQVFLYNHHLKAALVVASIAVEKKPVALQWHENLAQIAMWSLDYALGMKEWLYVVQHTQDEKKINDAMSTVKLSGFDENYIDMLSVLLHRHPDNPKWTIELALAQNRLAQPKHALKTLNIGLKRHPTPSMYAAKATIYQDLDLWSKALKTWEALENHFGPTMQSVMAKASIFYHRRQFELAVVALKKGMTQATDQNNDFWDTLADLSWIINDNETARLAYKRGKKDTYHLIRLIELEKIIAPQEALNHSLYGWVHFHLPIFLSSSLSLILELRDWNQFNQLIAHFTPQELKSAEHLLMFWQAKSANYASIGNKKMQKKTLIEGISKHPELAELKNELLYLVLNQGEYQWIKSLLIDWYPQHLTILPDMWQVFAESFMALKQYSIAVQLYQTHMKPTWDFQTWLNYAGLLDNINQKSEAYHIRTHVLQRILTPPTQLNIPTLQILSQLSPYFLSGTEQWHICSALLTQQLNEQNLNLVLNWLSLRNDIDWMQWIHHHTPQPVLSEQMRIQIAMLKNDLSMLQQQTQSPNQALHRGDSMRAALRLENTRLAETLAVAELNARPSAQDIHEEFVNMALNDAENVRIWQEEEMFVNIAGGRTKIEGQLRLTNTWSVLPYVNAWNSHSVQSSQIVNVPKDSQARLKWVQKIFHGQINYVIGFRDALSSFLPAGVDITYQLTSKLHALLGLNYNQENYQTPYMRVGGVQDQVDAKFIYNSDQHTAFEAELEGLNYYSQNRHYLGNGLNIHGLATQKIWLSYPDFTLGIFGDAYLINRNGTFGGNVTTLFPSLPPQSTPALMSADNAINYQLLLPNSYYQGGVQFSFGDTIQEYSAKWRPYFFGRAYYNTLTNFSNNVKVGINGSLLGRDSLLLYAEYGTAPAQATSTTYKLGARYSIYF